MAAHDTVLSSRHRECRDALRAGAEHAEHAVGVDAKTIAIGEIGIELRFVGSAAREALFGALRHLESPGHTAEITITLWDTETTGTPPPLAPFGPGQRVVLGEVEPGGDSAIRILSILGSPALMSWDAARQEAVVWILGAGSVPGHDRASPLRTLLHWALEPHGIFLTHSACVAPRGGGVLITGASGVGKSTVAVACLERGLEFVGDDYVALTAQAPLRALSLYSTAKLDRASIELLGGLPRVPRGRPVDPPPAPKEVLRLADHRSEMLRVAAPLRAIVVPDASAPPGLRPVGGAEILRSLAPASLLQVPQDGRAAMRFLAATARALPGFRLGLGDDLDRVATEIAGLCDPTPECSP